MHTFSENACLSSGRFESKGYSLAVAFPIKRPPMTIYSFTEPYYSCLGYVPMPDKLMEEIPEIVVYIWP